MITNQLKTKKRISKASLNRYVKDPMSIKRQEKDQVIPITKKKKVRSIDQHQGDLSYMVKALQAGNSKIVNENANKDSRVFNTQRDLSAGILAKTIGLDRIQIMGFTEIGDRRMRLSPAARQAGAR